MPGFIAKRLCPQLIIVPLNFDKYRAVSREVSLMSHPYLEPFTDFLCHKQMQLQMPSHIRIWP